MKWTSPQSVSAMVSLGLGFLLCYIAFFLSDNKDVPDGALWVLGQAFLYAGGIFGIKGYVDGKFIRFKNDQEDKEGKAHHK